MKVQSEQSVLNLATAIELTSRIVAEVSGTDIADTVNGSVVGSTEMRQMVGSIVTRELAIYTSANKAA